MKYLTNLSLWKKITILTTLGLILGVGAFSYLSMRAVNQATEAMLQDRLTTAHLVADHVDKSLDYALNELKDSVQTMESTGIFDGIPIQHQMEMLEAEYCRLSIHTYGIYLLNEECQIIWSKPESLKGDKFDISIYPDISQAIKGKEATVSRIVSAPASDTPVIFLVSPVNMQQNAGKRALCVAIDLAQSNIGLFVRPIRLGQTGYVEIVDQSGAVVTRTEPGPKLAPFEKSDHSGRFAALIDAAKPTRGICHTCHEAKQQVDSRDVLAFVPLTKARWGVVVRQSEEEALAPASELRQNLLYSGIGLAIMALLFVTVTARDLGGRISMLTIASRRIARGDLTSPVATSGKDEIGILAQTFDEMRRKLEASRGSLEQKTRELSSLLSVSEILTSTLDLPHLLEAVITKAVEVILGADGGVLLFENAAHDGLILQCAVGLDIKSLSQTALRACGGPSSDSNSQTADRMSNAVTAFLQSEALRSRIRSFMRAEVVRRSHHIGSLIVTSSKHAEVFSDSNHRLLQAIADDIAIAIERDQLMKEADEVRALHEADRLRSQFISSISHELRTPLTVIKGYATSLLRRNFSWDEKTRQEFLQAIDAKSDELGSLIDKLLQSAKLEAGALRLEKEPVLIPQLARQIVEESVARTKKHKFTLRFPAGFPVVEADGHCIEQVLRNLIENAVKYSPDGGQITISGGVRDSRVEVSVMDEGIGIPPEYHDKIFQRFYRVQSQLTRNIPGCGLGLSICKGHVEAHGGKIWLDSTPGKGSIFRFSLPLSTEGEKRSAQGVTDGRENVNSTG